MPIAKPHCANTSPLTEGCRALKLRMLHQQRRTSCKPTLAAARPWKQALSQPMLPSGIEASRAPKLLPTQRRETPLCRAGGQLSRTSAAVRGATTAVQEVFLQGARVPAPAVPTGDGTCYGYRCQLSCAQHKKGKSSHPAEQACRVVVARRTTFPLRGSELSVAGVTVPWRSLTRGSGGQRNPFAPMRVSAPRPIRCRTTALKPRPRPKAQAWARVAPSRPSPPRPRPQCRLSAAHRPGPRGAAGDRGKRGGGGPRRGSTPRTAAPRAPRGRRSR